jgi:hypothetical protein
MIGIDHQRLWRAVIKQALADATVDVKRISAVESAQARRWLTTPSKDLALVCEYADASMHKVIEYATKEIAEYHSKPQRQRMASGGRSPRKFTHNGQSLTVKEWAHELGITVAAMHRRFSRGWPLERVLTPAERQRGGGSKLSENTKGPADLHRARYEQNSVSQPTDSTCQA